jgi:type IV pilus assembly protein PilQ
MTIFMKKVTHKKIIGLFSIIFSCLILVATTSQAEYNPAIDIKSINSAENNNKLSFYFQDIEIRALLQLIAKSAHLNFIVSDSVKGNITLNLKNVTWQEALNIILQSRGLASRHIGNVVFISTIEDITSNETRKLHSEEEISSLAPVTSKLIHLKYTSATDVAALLKGPQSQLLTSRGQVAVDSRTNSLIIRDTKASLADIIPEIHRLDVPARQVLIEARIVNVDTSYEEDLGVRFGVTNPTHLTGTFAGGNSMNQGASPQNVTNLLGIVDPTKRLNFNVPAAALSDGANPGSIAITLARIGSNLLDLELSALEGESHARIIARPRVVTANQQKAVIQTGEEIPYQEATSSGATSVTFKNALLMLEIVPQITPDNKINLSIKATEDSKGENIQVGTTGSTPTTIPAINTQEVQSNVLLNNNETIVLGGVYKLTKENTIDRIPFLGSLPVIGYLFSHTREASKKSELLIFITPKIIESRPTVAQLNERANLPRPFKGEN